MEVYEGRQKWLHDRATIRDQGLDEGMKTESYQPPSSQDGGFLSEGTGFDNTNRMAYHLMMNDTSRMPKVDAFCQTLPAADDPAP